MLNIWKLVKRVLIFTWNNGYQPEAYTSDVQSTDYFKFLHLTNIRQLLENSIIYATNPRIQYNGTRNMNVRLVFL